MVDADAVLSVLLAHSEVLQRMLALGEEALQPAASPAEVLRIIGLRGEAFAALSQQLLPEGLTLQAILAAEDALPQPVRSAALQVAGELERVLRQNEALAQRLSDLRDAVRTKIQQLDQVHRFRQIHRQVHRPVPAGLMVDRSL